MNAITHSTNWGSRMFQRMIQLATFFVLSSIVGLPLPARAQCGDWVPGLPFPGINGDVYDVIEWDPDGPGPKTPLYVFGGEFTLAGSKDVQNIASLDPLTGEWDDMAGGITGDPFGILRVNALAVLPSGELLVGGVFGGAGGVYAPNIASWNGHNWSPFGPRLGSSVTDIAITPNGDLYISGPHVQYGPPERDLNWVAKWSGTQWLPLGSGMDNVVWALHAMPNGDLIAGGLFNNAGGVSSPKIARWDGSSWHRIAIGGPEVFAITSLPNGDIIAGGSFTSAGSSPANRVARRDGAQWNALGNGFNNPVRALAALPNGDIVAGGEFSFTGTESCRGAALWGGSEWSQLDGGVAGRVYALSATSNGSLLLGGAFHSAAGREHRSIVQWRNEALGLVAPGLDGRVLASATMPNGDMVVAGSFTQIGSIQANRIARWDGATWHPLGTGMDDEVLALAVLNNGELVAAGRFTTAGGASAKFIARWNGSTWSHVSGGMNAYVNCLAVAPNGDLIAAGAFRSAGALSAANHIARWNGIFWQPFGTGFPGSIDVAPVAALAVMPSGHVIAGGDFGTVGGVTIRNIAQWNGSAWSQIGPGISISEKVTALAVGPDQLLYAGGSVLDTTISRWNGTSWAAVGTSPSELRGRPKSILFLPNGDLIAAGDLTLNGARAGMVHRWDGLKWHTMDSGFDHMVIPTTDIGQTIALDSTGDLWVSGRSLRAHGFTSAFLARWRPGGAPEVTEHPTDETVCPTMPSTFFAGVSSEQTATLQWQVQSLVDPASWIDLVDGETDEYGVVAGATTDLLSLSSYGTFSESLYRCLVTSICGQAESTPAALILDESLCACPSDYNNDDTSDILDLLDFLSDLDACNALPAPCGTLGNPDLNNDGVVDILDLLDFLDAFSAGC